MGGVVVVLLVLLPAVIVLMGVCVVRMKKKRSGISDYTILVILTFFMISEEYTVKKYK